MKRQLVITGDGSHTICIPERGLLYHSRHGAIRESLHVFIESGLKFALAKRFNKESRKYELSAKDRLKILEIGFGTGLNALLTLLVTAGNTPPIYYEAVELYPLESAITRSINYCDQLGRPESQPLFDLLHSAFWDKEMTLRPNFTLLKTKEDWRNFRITKNCYDLIYYDAFAPGDQPELWTQSIFEKLYTLLNAGGLLLTYCSKTRVRKGLETAGFFVEKLPGPPHKREILRALKMDGPVSHYSKV